MLENIKWLGHASIKINFENKIIYVDPFEIKNNKDKSDIILITHDHYDHCSPDDIKKIATQSTTIVAPKDCASKLPLNTKIIAVNQSIDLDKNIKIKALPAYNTNKSFHPKNKGWLGYVLTLGSYNLYIAGDTDLIDEMKNLKNIDIAFLPVSGTYVMTAEEASQAALIIKPKVAIPIHYGSIVGKELDAQKFKNLLESKVQVIIKNKEQ